MWGSRGANNTHPSTQAWQASVRMYTMASKWMGTEDDDL